MPYIQQDMREIWNELVPTLVDRVGTKSSKLIFLLKELAHAIATPENYANYERAMGFLTCVHHEYERRIFFIYRDTHFFEVEPEHFEIGDITSKIGQIRDFYNIEDCKLGGHLNYLISSVINELLEKESFEVYQVGVILRHVVNKFYSQVVGVYEDIKINENGEVFSKKFTDL